MTTQKAQRKIKTSTVAITVLSILLAIAVVSTIVLAAFTASRTATTTITFGQGLELTVTGISASPTAGQTYAWKGTANGGASNETGQLNDITQSFTLDEITIASSTAGGAYIIAKATVKSTAGTATPPTVTPNALDTNWFSIGTDGDGDTWYVYGSDASTPSAVEDDAVTFVNQISVNSIDDTYAGATFTANFEVQAVNVSGYTSAADALTALKGMASIS